MTNNSEAILDIQFLARRYNELDQLTYSVSRDSLDASILALEENDKFKSEIEHLKEEVDYYKNECCLQNHINNELKSELEQSIKLPCKTGDTLFSIENGIVEEFKAKSLSHIFALITFNRFGDTVFLNEKDAYSELKSGVE